MDPDLLGRLADDQVVQILKDAAREIARLQALQLRAAANLCQRRAGTDGVSEVALELKTTEKWAGKMVATAIALTTRLPRTLDLMDRGRLDFYRAMLVANATASLSAEEAGIVEVRLVGKLPKKDPEQVRKSATYEVGRLDKDAILRRSERQHADRRVRLHHNASGTSHLSISNALSEKAIAAYGRIDRTARALKTQGDERTLDQIRTDVAVDLLLSGDGGEPEHAEVFVYLDLATYLGLNDDPAELAGHGPIPAAFARRIAAGPDTVLRRLITDPMTGQVIDLGENRYQPSAETTEFVRIRDRECRHPGCTRPAQNCSIEFTTERHKDGRPTGRTRPASYCERHRRLKNRPGWEYHVDPDGNVSVTTPADRTHTGAAPSLHPPRRRGKRKRGSAW
jgi:hypothetical protein